MPNASIRFRNGDLDSLREKLLEDLANEQYAILFGKTEVVNNTYITTVREIIYPLSNDLEGQSVVSLRINRQFVGDALDRLRARIDCDTLIDVHTHPFSKGGAAFSGTDDMDEKRFYSYLTKEWPDINYASIVLSQTMYDARFWSCGTGRYINAEVKTQLMHEAIKHSSYKAVSVDAELEAMFNRGILALGVGSMKS